MRLNKELVDAIIRHVPRAEQLVVDMLGKVRISDLTDDDVARILQVREGYKNKTRIGDVK